MLCASILTLCKIPDDVREVELNRARKPEELALASAASSAAEALHNLAA
jgi:hypothetical protein